MKLDHLQAGDVADVAVEAVRPGDLDGVALMEPIALSPSGDGLVSLIAGGRRILLRLTGTAASGVSAEFARPTSRLLAIVAHDGTSAVLRSWTFSRDFDLRERTLTVQLDEVLLQAIAKATGGAVSEAAAQEWLSDEFLLDGPSEGIQRAILRVDNAATSIDRGFVIVGTSREMDIRAAGDALLAVRLAPRRHESVLATILLTAQLRFATALADIESDEVPLGVLIGDDSYLRQWARYGEAEHELESTLAESLGTARYVDAELLAEGTWRFALAGGSDLLSLVSLHMELDARSDSNASGGRPGRFSGVVENIDRTRRSLDLRPVDPNKVPAPVGTLAYSISGSLISHQRRVAAAQKLSTGGGPLPELTSILEMRSSAPRRVDRRFSWESAATRSIFGSSQPTDAQKRAIEIALNTPDVAVIQGPPGTGKTQVIAAIAARVAEEIGDTGAMRQILLTSFQHDAVDNVASRTMVFGLPAIKETARDHGGSWLGAWRQDRLRHAAELFDKIEQGELARRRTALVERRNAYLLAPVADESAADLLDDVATELGPNLSTRLVEDLQRKSADLRRARAGTEKNLNLIAAIRALRTLPIAHDDDGPATARRLAHRLATVAVPDHLDLEPLEVAQEAETLSDEQFRALGATKEALLDAFGLSRVRTTLPSRNDDVVRLVNDAIRELDAVLKIDGQGLAAVLSRFVHDLESDSRGVENSLAQYAAVIAATCQAAASLAARPDAVDDTAVFDTVIVDEAARANPLDLQIPLSIASRRVVLVGDQRQLPHIVDDEIASALAAGDAERSELDESLFGRLFRFLQSERTQARPDRVVTLNTQFRMHPRLGAFVSENFYEPFGERIESVRPPEDFTHDLPGYQGRVAHWLDVPARGRREERAGTSWLRDAEASSVASEVKRLMDSAPQLTFGVITFYSAQRDLILDQLHGLGVANRDPDTGAVGITADQWRYTTDTAGNIVERLRVGTVDAFQGKEFDVALLSIVRSPSFGTTDAARAFGHLRIMNRLCVAMSRQRRLLIAVGDRAGLLGHPLAEDHIAPLCALGRLCDEATS